MSHASRWIPILVLFSLPVARGAVFEANHLFSGGWNGGQPVVVERDEELEVVREFGLGDLESVVDLAFGPGGLLYVADTSADRVKVFDADGAHVDTIGSNQTLNQPSRLAFGANGHLYVALPGQEIVEFDRNGSFVRAFSPPTGSTGTGLAVAADGLVYTGSYLDQRIDVFAPDGVHLRSIAVPEAFQDFCIGPRGNLHVTTDVSDQVLEIRMDGSLAGSVGNGAGMLNPSTIVFGPDKNLYVFATGSATLFVFDEDGVLLREVHPFGAWAGFAFAPARFHAKISGRLGRSQKPLQKLVEKSAVLSVAPGSGTAFLELTDDPGDPFDLASYLGTDVLVLQGIHPETDGKKELLLQGVQQAPGLSSDSAFLALTLSGKTDAHGMFRTKKAKGTLHARAGGTFLSATLKASKPAN